MSSTPARRRERFGLLLGAVVLSFAVQGIASPNEWQEVVIDVLLGVTLMIALWVADARPLVIRSALAVVAVVVLTGVSDAINHTPGGATMRLSNALLVVLAPPAVVVGVVRSLRQKETVTLEAVFGVLSVYILIGMFFAALYGSIDHIGTSAFFAGGQPATVANCMYFSFTTLTTVGYGDFTAGTNLGHTLAVSEGLVGQIYLVTIVSLIVANLGRPRSVSRES